MNIQHPGVVSRFLVWLCITADYDRSSLILNTSTMKKFLSFLVLCLLLVFTAMAQSILKLDPDQLYKADRQFTPEDWSGFYISSNNKDIMMIIPDGNGGIKGFYTNDYYGKWVEREGFSNQIRIFDKHGKMTERKGMLMGELIGKITGNGVRFLFRETVTYDNTFDQDSGFMVMKDNKEDVFAKVGGDNLNGIHVFGLKNTLLYSMVKKRPLEMEPNTLPDDKWLGEWKMNLSAESSLKLEPFGEGMRGFYTLKGYREHYSTVSSIVWEKVPPQLVMVLGFPVGNKFFYLSNNYVLKKIYTGVIEMSPDMNSFKGQEVRWDVFGVKWKSAFGGKR